jgi:hypothetical protein
VRLTLDLSPGLAAELERLATETGRSKADVLRLGLDLLSRASAARRDGMHVGAWDDGDGGERRREREFVGVP